MTDGLLPGADRDLVKPLPSGSKSEFEAIYLNTKVVSLADKKNAIEVTFEGEVRRRRSSGSTACWSPWAGGRTATDLGLENTKVEVDQRGFVVVDHQQRTADPQILAIGDVAGEPMLAHKAAHEGKVAVEALAGEPAVFEPRAIPAVVFTDPEIAWAGLTETEAEAAGPQGRGGPVPLGGQRPGPGRRADRGHDQVARRPGEPAGAGLRHRRRGAGDLISEAVLAIEMGAEVRDLTDSIHPHPTLSETLGGAAEVYLGTATDLYRPKRKGRPGRPYFVSDDEPP